MTDEQIEEIIQGANKAIEESTEKPMSVEDFVKELINDPRLGRSAHQYLLDAIEYFGKRTVFERGEEKERYRFFDDPSNDGEHAVLGNTDILNSFVEDLRVIANSNQRMQKIMLFSGPTATGKSELKRCIVNGLRSYSKTDSGRRYTCDWNSKATESRPNMMYGDGQDTVQETVSWSRSPVQVNPISILPRETRDKIQSQVEPNLITDVNLDPFSQKEYDTLKSYYETQNSDDIFSSITDINNVRVRRYTVDETQGIGILTAEDDGSVKERLLGSWMPSMLRELESIGQKDPRAFSYDGVLSQGNGGVTVVEDATKHADILLHLLNVPDEEHAKIDKEIGFDVDTVPIFISNPDLVDQKLNELSDKKVPIERIHGLDPLKAIKRRMFQYEVQYLTSITDESRLIRKEVNGYTEKQKNGDVNPRDKMQINGTEFAPHTIQGVAMYNVVSRLGDDNLPDDLTICDKALLFDRGYIDTDEGRKTIDEFEIDELESDGDFGIPVTYTRDVLRSIVHSRTDDKEVYLPSEVLDILSEGLSETPVFGDNEVKLFEDKIPVVKEYINEKQEHDVIEAILADRKATEEAVKEYVDNVYEWVDNNEDEYDPYLLKDFEMKHLGTDEDQYDGQDPNQEVIDLRKDRIISPLNRYHWRQRDDEFEISEETLNNIPVLSQLLGKYNWSDVFREHPNLDPMQWENPPDDTPTDEIKTKCIENLIDLYDYSEESARMTFEVVFSNNREKLDDIKESVTDS